MADKSLSLTGKMAIDRVIQSVRPLDAAELVHDFDVSDPMFGGDIGHCTYLKSQSGPSHPGVEG